MKTNTVSINADLIRSLATESEAEALHEWYGAEWAERVLVDDQRAIEDCTSHALYQPCDHEFMAYKLSARAAWRAIEAKLA